MTLALPETAMGKVQQAAFLSVGRAVGFSGLAITTVMVGLSFDPLLALRSGGVLLFLLLASLLLKAFHAPSDYRHTETWLLLDSHDRPDERYAGPVLTVALREASLWFARWTAGVAAIVWGGAVLLALAGFETHSAA